MLIRLLRRFTIRVLGLVGIDPRSAGDVASDLGEQKWRLALALLASVIAPIAEISFITVLYAIVEPAQQQALLASVERWSGIAATALTPAAGRGWLIGAAAMLLTIAVGSKYTFGLAHAQFLLSTFVTQSRRVVQAYLYASPRRVAGLERANVASAAMTEASKYGRVVYSSLDALSNVLAAVVFLFAAIALSPGLVLIAASVALFTLFVTARGFRRQKETGKLSVEVQAALVGSLWEILNGYRTVKIEGGERHLLQRLVHDLRSKQAWRLVKARNELYIKLGSESTLYLALLGIVILSTAVLRIEASLVLVFLVLMARLQKYLGALQQSWIEVQHSLPSLATMSDIIDRCQRDAFKPLTWTEAGAQPAEIHLACSHLSFAYGDEPPVLRDISLIVPPGERVLIQGGSGQGKSTLLYLLAGLLPPTTGHVHVNGRQLDDEQFYRLRPSVTYVAPNTYLFRGSIRENLCLGTEYADRDIADAIRRARLQTLVERLSHGIDTDIGENGALLSLGERQRVMLARIFLKRPKLILLDEATANLDLDNERAILTDLFQNMPSQATVILVAHRAPLGVAFTRSYLMQDRQLVPRAQQAST